MRHWLRLSKTTSNVPGASARISHSLLPQGRPIAVQVTGPACFRTLAPACKPGRSLQNPPEKAPGVQRTARPGRLPSPAETSPRTQAPGPRVIGVSHSHSHVLTLKTRACGLVLTNKDLQDLLGGFKIVKTSTVSLFRFLRKFSLSLALGQSLRPTSEALQDTARATRAHPSEGPVTSAGAMGGGPPKQSQVSPSSHRRVPHTGPPGRQGAQWLRDLLRTQGFSQGDVPSGTSGHVCRH